MTDHTPLPVAGYPPQSDDNVKLANELKEAEERYLRILDRMDVASIRTDAGYLPLYQGRFIALARTHMQTANMFAVRAIFQPQRTKLPEDAP